MMAKLEIFLSCPKCTDSFVCGSGCIDELMSFLAYDTPEISSVEKSTRGQAINPYGHQ